LLKAADPGAKVEKKKTNKKLQQREPKIRKALVHQKKRTIRREKFGKHIR